MRTISTLLLSGALLLSSCKKDNIPDVPPVNEGPADVTEFNLGDTIEFGLTDNMVIDSDSIVIQGILNNTVTHDMDVDGDGTLDFQIRLVLSMSPGMGSQIAQYLTPLHANAAIHGLHRTDTTFLHNDTASATLIQRTYSCSRIAATDPVVSTSPNIPKFSWSNSGDLLTTAAGFVAEEVKLYQTNGSAPIPNYEPPYTINTYYNRNCFLLPADQVVYIGVTLLDGNGGARLGWLKVKRGAHFVIYERAVQEL